MNVLIIIYMLSCSSAAIGFQINDPSTNKQTNQLEPLVTTLKDTTPQRIVGGHEIDIGAVPFQASLQSCGVHLCGGSIIHKQWVLTAGHCVSSPEGPTTNLTVRVGSVYHEEGGQVVNVEDSIRHPLYDELTFDYDFALLRLEQGLTFSHNVAAIQLPMQDEFFQDGTVCAVSGWGDTLNPNESSGRLRATNVPIVNDAICQTAYISVATITERMLCAGYADACQGDSGGPLFYENTLIGLVSWRKGCAEADYPGVYSRLTSVRAWINEVSDV